MSEVHNGNSRSSLESMVQTIVVYAVVIAVALVGGYYLARELIPAPKIGVINLQGAVGSVTANVMAREIQYAREADDIKGVVMIVNSPGGGARRGMIFIIRCVNCASRNRWWPV